MTRVVLGNRNAIHSADDGATFTALPKGKRATVVDFGDDVSFLDALRAVTDPAGVWTYHAVGPDGDVVNGDGDTVTRKPIHAGVQPAWVASDNPALAEAIAQSFGGVPVRELEDPYEGRFGGGGGTGKAKQAPLMMLMLAVLWLAAVYRLAMAALKTNAGNDFQYNQMAGSASATAVGKWVGLTANVTAPAAGDTTLTGEITTAGGGLIRKAGTPAHTTGAASYTITTVFTANGSDVLPVTIGKRGIFDAVTAGNMVFETLVSPTATLSASGDNLTLTDTISM